MAQYYLSSSGNDSNAGTSAGAPWLTIGKVNSVGLNPGDGVYLRGGDTFTGNLLVNPATQPGSGTRIVVSSYGTGSATINCGDSYAVKVLDCGFVTVSNLISVGSGIVVTGTYPNKDGTTTSTTGGFLVMATTSSTWYDGIIIDGVEASGSLFGILFQSTYALATAAFENYQVTNCYTHHDGVAGIWTVGLGVIPGHLHENPNSIFRYGYIADCQSTYHPGITNYNYGNPGYVYWSGFGIFPFSNDNSLIERCFVTECGDASYNNGGGGPVGIIFVIGNSNTIRSCEVSNQYATADIDGNGFDLECNDSIIEYCYAHNCGGSGILFFNATNPTARYNIVENCGRECRVGALICGGGNIYQNTFFHAKSSAGPAELMNAASASLRNNIFVVQDGGNFGNAGDCTLQGNVYYVGSGSSFSLIQSSNTYTSLVSMQAAGLEKLSGAPVGASGNPLFSNPGINTTCLPATQVKQLANYDLGTGSAAHGTGLDLSQFSITAPTHDWHDNVINPAAPDSGAVGYGSHYQSGPVGTPFSVHHFSFL